MNNQITKKSLEPEVLDDNTVIQIGNKLFACKSIMEVAATEDESQTVLLEGMEGTQYIIQRNDGGDMSKGALFALTGELISEGMVVDMISAGVGSEYNTATQYYEGEDLLTQDMTEEDRRLADALVAVQQYQQQQKQQMQTHNHHQESSLPNVTHLANLSTVNAYSIQTIPEPDPPPVYPSIQTFKRVSQNVKRELVNVKCEYETDATSTDNIDEFSQNGPKRTLPHKKRKNWEERKHPRKVKQVKKSTAKNKENNRVVQETVTEITPESSTLAFKCELCSSQFKTQLNFFEHLKIHYEPFIEEKCVTQQTRGGNTISINIAQQNNVQEPNVQEIEEFSEPEDLMEGIRGVVEETEAHIDEENENSLPTSNSESNMWSLTNSSEQNDQRHSEPTTTVAKNDLQDTGTSDSTTVTKKKKNRTKTIQNLTCQQCDRTFHHKNSLVYHMRSHSGERPHQCEICGKSFFAASALKVHKRLHSGDKPYKCEECGRHFRQWGDLKYHSTSLHSEQKQFQCEYCGKDFARKYSLIVHRRIHTGEKNYLCEYCNKTFRASSYLQNHRRIHTGEKPHACDICGKPFRVRSDMKRHLHTHTRSRNERPANRSIAQMQKNAESDAQKVANNKAKTIQDLVQELKLEVEPNGAVEIVAGPQTPESILPHEGTQNLEYEVSSANENSNEKDPLESVVRTGDEMPYFFM